MIVSCSSCSTRFRHHEEPESAHAMAICSRCDSSFPLVPAKRSYVILPMGSAARGPTMGIGMDDPLLAPQIDSAAVLATPGPEAAPVSVAAPVSEAAFEQQVPSPVPESAPRRERPTGEFPLILFLAGMGCAATYYVAPQGSPAGLYLAMAGGAGLLLGWAWMRWVARKR